MKHETKIPEPEEKYLNQLGFNVHGPRLYPKNRWLNVTLPVFITAVAPSESHFIFGFLKSFQHYFPTSFLIIYDLGLNPADFALVSKFIICFFLNVYLCAVFFAKVNSLLEIISNVEVNSIDS